MTLTADLSTSTSFDLGPARALSCRECGHETPLAAEFACTECFGPLEVAYDFGDVTRASIEAGPEVDLALPAPAARAHHRRRAPQHRARPHPADQGRPPRQGAGHPQPLGQGRHRQPDALVQGPGRRRGPRRRPRAGLPRAVLPVHRQPGQRRRRRGRPRGLGFGGAHPVVAGAGQGADDRRVRGHAARRRRQLRRRQPARHRARGRARGLGVRQRQRPPVLRGGLQDAGLRGRRAARVAAAGADRRAGGVGVAADQGRQGVHASSASSGSSRPRRTRCSARRPPAARRWRRRSRRATT